jgi:signal transduction histidine kinase
MRSNKQSLVGARALLEENLLDTKRLQKLSHSLLLLAQTPTKARTTPPSRVALDKVVESVARSMMRRMDAKHITYTYSLDPVQILGDPDELFKLVEVLLDNAIKYSPAKSTVSLELIQKRRRALLRVSDSGPGINSTDHPHIFDRFYRTDDARGRLEDEGGYGLGLSIAKRIVTEHAGVISVKNGPEHGCIFEVRIPCDKT